MSSDPAPQDDPLQQLDDTEKRALIELARERASEYVDRRSILKGAAGVSGALAAGAVGYNEGVQQAKADASTSDGDGDVGTPSNPVDVFADGVDAVSVGADNIDISQFSQGYNRLIYRDDNYIYALDRHGDVVAGGPDALNVTDATDMGEVFETTVNNAGTLPSIFIAAANTETQTNTYTFKSKAQLAETPNVYGAGRNRTQCDTTAALAGQNVIEMLSPNAGFITHWADIKFTNTIPDADQPDTWLRIDNVKEVMFSHAEFRDSQTWGPHVTDFGGYNCVFDTWFLNGSGFKFEGGNELRLIGNRTLLGATSELSSVQSVIKRGNDFRETITETNVTYARPDEAFGDVDASQIGNSAGALTATSDIDLAGFEISNGATAGIEPFEVTVADTASEQLDPNATKPVAIYMITVGNGDPGIVAVGGATNTVWIMSDPNAGFSTTQGNAGTVNIYYDATNTRYSVENQTGASQTLGVFSLRR